MIGWRARRRLIGPPAPPEADAWRPPAALVAAGVGVALIVATAGPVLAVAVGAGAVATPVVVGRRRRAERDRRRRRQLPEALDHLATVLRAGSSVPMALASAGAAVPPPLGDELARLGREADGGWPVVEVLERWTADHDDAATRLAATALTLATVVGGAPARAVEGVAATLRERVHLADERRALGAQARLSALVLALAPAGFAVLLGATDGTTAAFLLGTPAGWLCLAVGGALDAAGAMWMVRLTQGRER